MEFGQNSEFDIGPSIDVSKLELLLMPMTKITMVMAVFVLPIAPPTGTRGSYRCSIDIYSFSTNGSRLSKKAIPKAGDSTRCGKRVYVMQQVVNRNRSGNERMSLEPFLQRILRPI